MEIFLLLIYTVVCKAGYITPEQVHLSWTENPGEVRVTWVTFFPILNSIYYRSILCENESNWEVSLGSSSQFSAGKYVYRYEYIHTGVIPVEKSCKYEYYVGSWYGWSDIYKFSGRTHDPKDLGPTNIVVVADWGGGSQGVFTKNLLDKELKFKNADVILHAGDIAYDMFDLEGMVGDYWVNMVQPIAANYAYMTLPGNHETDLNYTHYRNKFIMPWTSDNEGSGHFYSFDIGRSHYIMLNSEVLIEEEYANQILTEMNWLKRDLAEANANREIRPWIIMLTHRNMYCSFDWNHPNWAKSSDCMTTSIRLREILEDLIFENGVDLFLQAHVHNYERNTPIYKNLTVKSDYDDGHLHINPRAPVYITNGNAGNIEGHNDPPSSTPQDWSIISNEEYGYGRLIIHNTTHLYYEQYSADTLEITDYVWIIKDKPRY